MKDTIKDESPQFTPGGRRAHYILIVCTLLYIINYMDRQVFAVILQPMKIDLGLTDAQCGLASTVLIIGMAFFSFPVSYLVDRWSRRKSIGLMAVLWSGATFATGLAKNFTGVLIPRFFVGLGEAGFVPGGTALIAASYPKEKRGRAMGAFNLAIPLGAAVGVIFGGIISAKYGWRSPFLFFALPGVVLGILAFFMAEPWRAASSGGAARSTPKGWASCFFWRWNRFEKKASRSGVQLFSRPFRMKNRAETTACAGWWNTT